MTFITYTIIGVIVTAICLLINESVVSDVWNSCDCMATILGFMVGMIVLVMIWPIVIVGNIIVRCLRND